MSEWVDVFIKSHITYLPLVVFSLLILAGMSIPISEDFIVIISGVLAKAYIGTVNPYFLYPALYLGAYLGDFISFFIGYFLGEKVLTRKPFNKIIKKELREKVTNHLKKHDAITLLLGRFIPFGVRTTLFLSCGISKMTAARFAFLDSIAVLITTSIPFFLSYTYGEIIFSWLDHFQIVILCLLLIVVTIFVIKWIIKKKSNN